MEQLQRKNAEANDNLENDSEAQPWRKNLVYGPKQVFKQGVLGNFEPRNYPVRTGPGKVELYMYYSLEQPISHHVGELPLIHR